MNYRRSPYPYSTLSNNTHTHLVLSNLVYPFLYQTNLSTCPLRCLQTLIVRVFSLEHQLPFPNCNMLLPYLAIVSLNQFSPYLIPDLFSTWQPLLISSLLLSVYVLIHLYSTTIYSICPLCTFLGIKQQTTTTKKKNIVPFLLELAF